MRAISRGDSTFLDLAGWLVMAPDPGGTPEPGAPADLEFRPPARSVDGPRDRRPPCCGEASSPRATRAADRSDQQRPERLPGGDGSRARRRPTGRP